MRLSSTSAVLLGALLLVPAAPVTAAHTPAKGGAMHGMAMMKTPEKITMNAQNGSGETGTAMLKDTPKGLVVTLHIKGGGKGPQPVHIHKGSCAKLDPNPEYPLHNVVNGMSVTTVKGVTIGELNGKTAINVHKSLTDIPSYVSCGDIAAGGM